MSECWSVPLAVKKRNKKGNCAVWFAEYKEFDEFEAFIFMYDK